MAIPGSDDAGAWRAARPVADDDVMGGRVSFLSVTEADAKAAASWLDDDPEGQEEFGGFYGIHPKWWSLVSADNSRYGWTLWRGAEPVGFVDAEVDFEGTAEVVVYIRPSPGAWDSARQHYVPSGQSVAASEPFGCEVPSGRTMWPLLPPL